MIALLGWGSLFWDPRDLSIGSPWNADGPVVRVEFLRQSNNGRLTLVLSENAEPVHSLWTTFSDVSLTEAAEELRKRENIPRKNSDRHISSWSQGESGPASLPGLQAWADAREIESVVWTTLPSKFSGVDDYAPSLEEAVSYLDGLASPVRELAEEYVRRAPKQIDTRYRRRIEAELGWYYSDGLAK